MKRIETRHNVLYLIYRGLIIILVILGLLFIGTFIYTQFIANRTGVKKQDGVSSVYSPGQEYHSNIREGQTFTGIGQVRVSTADPQPGMVILFVTFLYYPEDKAFSEELAIRVRELREIIIDYVGLFSSEDLRKMSEDTMKMELLRRFNTVLRLGRIETLFFSDFMIIG